MRSLKSLGILNIMFSGQFNHHYFFSFSSLITFAGDPMMSELSGNSFPSVINEFAPTIEFFQSQHDSIWLS